MHDHHVELVELLSLIRAATAALLCTHASVAMLDLAGYA